MGSMKEGLNAPLLNSKATIQSLNDLTAPCHSATPWLAHACRGATARIVNLGALRIPRVMSKRGAWMAPSNFPSRRVCVLRGMSCQIGTVGDKDEWRVSNIGCSVIDWDGVLTGLGT